MKKFQLLISVAFIMSGLLFFSCRKAERPFMNTAIITGSDQRYCICCGGLMITFNGETRPYTGDFKLIANSADLGLTNKDTFPLYVKVDWKADTGNVCGRISITRFARK